MDEKCEREKVVFYREQRIFSNLIRLTLTGHDYEKREIKFDMKKMLIVSPVVITKLHKIWHQAFSQHCITLLVTAAASHVCQVALTSRAFILESKLFFKL